MTGVYILLGGITLVAGIVTLLDWLGRRQQRKAHKGDCRAYAVFPKNSAIDRTTYPCCSSVNSPYIGSASVS